MLPMHATIALATLPAYRTPLAPRRRMSAATRTDLVAGARGMLPLMLAVTPQGLSLGLALGQMPGSHLTGWATSGLLYAGSSQLALMSTYASSGAAAILVTLIVNLRLLLYSAALAPQWRARSLPWRLAAGYLLVDPSFVLAEKRNGEPGSARSRSTYYLGGALLLWVWWQVVTGAGILAPQVMPHLGALSAAAPLCFVALLAGAVKERRTLVAAGTALVASVALGGLPLSGGLGVAMVLGLAAASVERRRSATPCADPQPAATPQAAATPQRAVTPRPAATPRPATTPRLAVTPRPAVTPRSAAIPQAAAIRQPAAAPEPAAVPQPVAVARRRAHDELMEVGS